MDYRRDWDRERQRGWDQQRIWMAAEDFSFYSQQAPSCFYRLGVRNEARGIISPVHTSTFDIDESALETGMGLMAWMAIKELADL